MPQFKYQAKKPTGKIYEKTIEASDRLALYGIIRSEGATVVSIQEKKINLPSTSLSFGSLVGRIRTQDKITLAKNLGSMIEAGLPVTRALSVMGKQSKRKALQALLASLEA